MPEMRTWQAMRDQITGQLERQTGEGVEAWNRRIKAAGPVDEPALRAWLKQEHDVTGYPAMLLAWETFGYPDFLTATADELVDAQYADRPDLRPIFDAVIAAVSALSGAEIQARKTYVSLVSPRRMFGIVQASTKKRVDLGLRLDDAPERLLHGVEPRRHPLRRPGRPQPAADPGRGAAALEAVLQGRGRGRHGGEGGRRGRRRAARPGRRARRGPAGQRAQGPAGRAVRGVLLDGGRVTAAQCPAYCPANRICPVGTSRTR